MNEPHDNDQVPADLRSAFPNVGAEPSSQQVSESEPLASMHALLDDEGPLERVSSLSTRTRWALTVGLVVSLAGLVLVTTRRADFDVYPSGRMALDLSLLLGPLLLALVAALRPLSRPALSVSRRVQAVVFGLLGIALMVGLPVAHTLHPASHAGEGALFWRQAGSCFAFGLGFAVLATMGLGALSRTRSRKGLGRWSPGALGIWAGGLVGLVSLYLHCPITELDHLWAGHGTVILPVLAFVFVWRNRLDG